MMKEKIRQARTKSTNISETTIMLFQRLCMKTHSALKFLPLLLLLLPSPLLPLLFLVFVYFVAFFARLLRCPYVCVFTHTRKMQLIMTNDLLSASQNVSCTKHDHCPVHVDRAFAHLCIIALLSLSSFIQCSIRL